MKSDVEKYLKATIDYGEATLEGDSKRANKNYKTLDSIFRTLKVENRLNELEEIVEYENQYTKLWVATHLLAFNENLGKNKLKKLASDTSSFVGFDAEMTLQEWEKGNLSYLVE